MEKLIRSISKDCNVSEEEVRQEISVALNAVRESELPGARLLMASLSEEGLTDNRDIISALALLAFARREYGAG